MFVSSFNSPFSFPKFDFQGTNRPRVQQSDGLISPSSVTEKSSEDRSQKIVDSHVVNTLEKVLNTNGVSLKGSKAEDFSPENVADNIMASVRQAFGSFKESRPEADEGEFFSQVKKGLDKGFNEARDVLQNLGVLQGEIAENVNKTYDLTMQGLDQLSSEGNSASVAGASLAFQSLETRSSRSASIQVETQEGDIVTINFSQASSSLRSALQIDQPGFSLNAYQESLSASNDFSVSVEGNLNKDEQKALKKLMKQMNKVSDSFFNGNGKKAIKQALKMGFDNEQIAGFSMDLSMQRSVQAVAAYQQTLVPEQPINTDQLGQAGDFMSQAKSIMAEADTAFGSLANPAQVFTDLFSEMGTLLNDGPEEQDDVQAFTGLIDFLGKDFFTGDDEKDKDS